MKNKLNAAYISDQAVLQRANSNMYHSVVSFAQPSLILPRTFRPNHTASTSLDPDPRYLKICAEKNFRCD